MKRKYTNKYHLRKWVVYTVLVIDKIIDYVVMPVLGALLFIMMYVAFIMMYGVFAGGYLV